MIQSYEHVRVWWGKTACNWVVQTPDMTRHYTKDVMFDGCVVGTALGLSPSDPEAFLLIRDVVVDHDTNCTVIVPDKTANVPAIKEHKAECSLK